MNKHDLFFHFAPHPSIPLIKQSYSLLNHLLAFPKEPSFVSKKVLRNKDFLGKIDLFSIRPSHPHFFVTSLSFDQILSAYMGPIDSIPQRAMHGIHKLSIAFFQHPENCHRGRKLSIDLKWPSHAACYTHLTLPTNRRMKS